MEGQIARERIERLFSLARKRVDEDREELADRYVELARAIGMRHNVSIPRQLRRNYCHSCYSYLLPGYNCRVRVNSGKENINYRCGECGEVNRFGFQD